MFCRKMILIILIFLSIAFHLASAEQIGDELTRQASGSRTDQQSPMGLQPDHLLDLAVKSGKVFAGVRRTLSSEVIWEPSGNALILVLPQGVGDGFDLVRIDLNSHEITPIVTGIAPELSPDGKYLSYVAEDGALQIVSKHTAAIEHMIELPTGFTESQVKYSRIALDFEWAPDSSGLAYIRPKPRPEQGTTRTIEANKEVRFFDVINGTDKKIFSPERDIRGLSYGPTGRLYFAHAQAGKDEKEAQSPDIRIAYYDSESGQAVSLTEDISNSISSVTPSVSSTGRYVAYVQSLDPDYFNYSVKVERAILDLSNGKRRILTDTPYSAPYGGTSLGEWIGGGSTLAFKCKPAAFWNTICSARVEASQLVLETMANIGAFAFSPNNKQVAWISRDLHDVIRVKVANADGSDKKTIYKQARTDLRNIALGEARSIRWKSYDGLEIEGLLILPVGYAEGTRVPLIVDIHGGPHGGVRQDGSLLQSSPLEWQMWAAKGFAVFLTDYRNSQVSGRDWNLVIRPPAMLSSEPDAKDVLAGVDYLVDSGIVDSERIVAIGHSHGSMVLNTLLTLTNRFTVAVSKEGVSDWRSISTDPSANPRQYKTVLHLTNVASEGLPRVLSENSAVVSAYKIRTPLLFIKAGSGREWAERMREETDNFVNAINQNGGMAEALFFPNDRHMIGEEENARIMLYKTIDWLDFWLDDRVRTELHASTAESRQGLEEQYARWGELRKRQEK